MKERRVKLGKSGITVRIETDGHGHCLETCPSFKQGWTYAFGLCDFFDADTPFTDEGKYKRCTDCIESSVNFPNQQKISTGGLLCC